jgi:hypothetical protein
MNLHDAWYAEVAFPLLDIFICSRGWAERNNEETGDKE